MSKIVSKRDLSFEKLLERTKESLRQAKNGETFEKEESIRKQIEEYRQQS